MSNFKLKAPFKPAGDQPGAINDLVNGLKNNDKNQVLLGVTGSGKTFTMAHVIEKTQRPTLIMAHNKTLAAQLYGEFKAFFPENAVEYFVSYYDYYMPEAYIPRTDTFIEKDSSINDQIDAMRHAATRALMERRDVIVVASVSCIYGIGNPEDYVAMQFSIKKGDTVEVKEILKHLAELQYTRNDLAFERGCFRLTGDTLDIFPPHMEDMAWRISFFGDTVETIVEVDPLTGKKGSSLEAVYIYPASHYVTPRPTMTRAIEGIKEELKERLAFFQKEGQHLAYERLKQRTEFDIEMLTATGMCKGIENYSRFLTGRKPGEPPPTLFEYLPKDALLFVDESHVSVPQIAAMYKGDRSRKTVLSEYGFRLPSCLDNRPLKFEEWDGFRPQTVFVSATPAPYELELTKGVVIEQVIRPTGLVDPACIIRPAKTQVDDLIGEVKETTEKGYRTLITTLTKKMSEDLTDYMKEQGIKVCYMHSDVETLERIQIIQDLRRGKYDALVGINLLREGLDIPECGMVAILDADKEGFLRSETALIQTIGRAARNVDGRVILYADKMTGALSNALKETERRRKKQVAYNEEHGIKPESIKKALNTIIQIEEKEEAVHIDPQDLRIGEKELAKMEKQMLAYAADLEFEKAAELRDRINRIKSEQMMA